jgi:hypothetical protein
MNINVSKSDDRGAPTVFPVSVSNVTTSDRYELCITIHDSRIIQDQTFTSNVAIRTRTTLRVASVSWLHLARPPFLPILEGPQTPVKSADLRLCESEHQTRNYNRLLVPITLCLAMSAIKFSYNRDFWPMVEFQIQLTNGLPVCLQKP